MKHFFLSALAAVLLLLCSAEVTAAVPHRLMYGYFNTFDNSGQYGLAKFYTDDPADVEFLDEGDNVIGVFCGACADGVMYYCEYKYSLTEGPVPSGFYSFNLTTGKKTLIGKYSDDTTNPNLKFQDMTYDYSSKTMYAVGFESGVSSLFTFDLTTGKPTKVIDLGKNLATLACKLDGSLYGIDQSGILYSVDKATGKCTQIFKTGYSGMQFAQTIEFDHTDEALYWAANTYMPAERRDTLYMVKIDLSTPTPTMTDVFQLPRVSETEGDEDPQFTGSPTLLSLYIPYVKAGADAPAAPKDLKVVPAPQGGNYATLSWTNPSETFGGKTLTGLKSVTVKRGDEVVATLTTAEPGKAMSFEDKNVPDGDYRYTVYATNETGDGEEAYAFNYVGRDCPDAPQNVTIKSGEGCQSAVLTWQKPAKGFHDGYYTEDGLTYRIVRQPDGKEVAKDLTDTTYTDTKLPRLGRYSYKVYAVNPYGETGTESDSRALGKAVSVTAEQPFMEDFTDRTAFENRWTQVDGNHDGYTWTFNTLAPTYQFGSSAPGAEYFVNAGVANDGNDADEWLITPPLNLAAGKNYQVKISARAWKDQNITITSGSTNEVADQNEVKAIVVKDGSATYPVPFTDYTVQLPVSQTDAIKCVGLHITTPYPADQFSFFHMTSLTVEEYDPTGITSLNAELNAGTSKVYNLNGQYVGSSLKGLAKGIYIAGGKKVVVK